MQTSAGMKKQLINHLKGGNAFMPVDEMLPKIKFRDIGKRPAGLPYSFYELFYHIRFTQLDILQYCRDKDYREHSWPADYWPSQQTSDNEEAWEDLKAKYFKEREELADLILSKDIELSDSVPSNKNHTYFREILLVIEHTSYHSGQLLILLRLLGLHSS